MSWANPGLSGLILIIVVLLLVFGPSKLPEIGKAFGKSLKEFKEATRGIVDDVNQPTRDAAQEPRVSAATKADPNVHVAPIELKEEDKSS